MILGGKRILKGYEEYQIEIIKEIEKTKDHESHSTAQAIIRNIDRAKKGNYRSVTSKADF